MGILPVPSRDLTADAGAGILGMGILPIPSCDFSLTENVPLRLLLRSKHRNVVFIRHVG